MLQAMASLIAVETTHIQNGNTLCHGQSSLSNQLMTRWPQLGTASNYT